MKASEAKAMSFLASFFQNKNFYKNCLNYINFCGPYFVFCLNMQVFQDMPILHQSILAVVFL